jgi:TusA-related sulfurtransferase
MAGKSGSTAIRDLSELTCTNPMIRLKILMKNADGGDEISVFVRRDQKDMIEVPFSRTGYSVQVQEVDGGRVLVRMKKGKAQV